VVPSACVTVPEIVAGVERLKFAVAVCPATTATEF
jgi:hypothetical protein